MMKNPQREKLFKGKFLEYKIQNQDTAMPIVISLPCTTMYALLNNKLDTSNIINQFGEQNKMQIINNSQCFRGDTLTSASYI